MNYAHHKNAYICVRCQGGSDDDDAYSVYGRGIINRDKRYFWAKFVSLQQYNDYHINQKKANLAAPHHQHQ